MGPRYTKAIIMLVVGSPVLAAGIIIDNSIETNKAQSSTVTIARLMIAAGACMVAIGIFICCIILTTNKKEEPNSPQHPSDVQLHRVRITTAPHTQPQQRGVQLVTYSPLPESQSVPYPQASRFNRNQVVTSPVVQFQRSVVTNTPGTHNNHQQPGTSPVGNFTHHQSTPATQITNQHSNPPTVQNQISNAATAQCQRSIAFEAKSQRSIISEAKSQRSIASEAKSQRSNVSEAKSQRSSASEAKSQRSNVSEAKSQRSSASEAKSQHSNKSEAKSQRSNVSESKSQRSVVFDSKSHRSNVSESKSQLSDVSDSKSQRSNTPEAKGKRPNHCGPNISSTQSKRSNPSATHKHRLSVSDTQNIVHHHRIPSQNIDQHRSISSESLIYPVNATDMAKLLTAAKKVMDPLTFDGIAKTYSIVYSSSDSQGELATVDSPMKGHVSSCSSSSIGQLSQSGAASSLLSQAKDQLGLETAVPLGNSPSAPPYQEQTPDFDPPPYCP